MARPESQVNILGDLVLDNARLDWNFTDNTFLGVQHSKGAPTFFRLELLSNTTLVFCSW